MSFLGLSTGHYSLNRRSTANEVPDAGTGVEVNMANISSLTVATTLMSSGAVGDITVSSSNSAKTVAPVGFGWDLGRAARHA